MYKNPLNQDNRKYIDLFLINSVAKPTPNEHMIIIESAR